MKHHLFLLVSLALTATAYAADSVTLTTYYPAPAGSYQSMRSTRMCIGANCHNGTATVADNNLYVQGNVGIGTVNPTVRLQVQGTTILNGRTTVNGPLTLGLNQHLRVRNIDGADNVDTSLDGVLQLQETTEKNVHIGQVAGSAAPAGYNPPELYIEGSYIRFGRSSLSGDTARNSFYSNPTTGNMAVFLNGSFLVKSRDSSDWRDLHAGNITSHGGDICIAGGTCLSASAGGALPGTLCGFEDASGTTVVVKCDGHSPATNCPSGYTKKQVAQVSGNELYSCIKQ